MDWCGFDESDLVAARLNGRACARSMPCDKAGHIVYNIRGFIGIIPPGFEGSALGLCTEAGAM